MSTMECSSCHNIWWERADWGLCPQCGAEPKQEVRET